MEVNVSAQGYALASMTQFGSDGVLEGLRCSRTGYLVVSLHPTSGLGRGQKREDGGRGRDGGGEEENEKKREGEGALIWVYMCTRVRNYYI
eukprot:1334206-Amorphochlora_amoeboformis.AAC.1